MIMMIMIMIMIIGMMLIMNRTFVFVEQGHDFLLKHRFDLRNASPTFLLTSF